MHSAVIVGITAKDAFMKEVLHCYCRVSSEIQSSEGTSLVSQKQLGKLKAKQLKMTPKMWLEGVASSDSEDISKREVLSALITAIEDGAVKHLYITEQSRLARTDNVASMIRHRCNVNGVILYIRDTVYDFNNPMDVLTVQIMSAFSQWENALRKERVRLGKLQKVRDGYWHGGEPPFGYKLKGDRQGNKLAIERTEAKWVKQIFNWYAEEQSIKYIQQKLRENYIQARRGGSFSIGSIQRLMKNTHSTGTYTFTDGVSEEAIEVSCPRIINDDLWHTCQSKRTAKIERQQQTNRTVRFSMLKELMWCAHCGGAMGAKIQPEQRKEYYYCPKKERVWKDAVVPSCGLKKNGRKTNKAKNDSRWERGRVCKMTRSLNIPFTNETVWNIVVEIASQSNVLKERVKSEMMSSKGKSDADYKSDIQNLQKVKKRYIQDKKDLETAIAKIETDRVMKRISGKQTKDILKNINEEMTVATKQLKQVNHKIKTITDGRKWIDWVSEFKKTYAKVDDFSEEQKQKYLQGIVERIDVRLDADTSNHLLDIKFRYPIVADRLVKSRKKKNAYTIYKGKHDKQVSPMSYQKTAGRPKKKAI
jgi:DNA invertase Pin-like site-specific DNA recombinase